MLVKVPRALLALAVLSTAACERPDTLGPAVHGAAPVRFPAAFSVVSGSATHVALPNLPNVTLAAAGARAINANGWLAGSTTGVYDGESFTRQRATVWTPSGPIDLGTLPPGSGFAWANDINDGNVVVGVARAANASGACCVLRAFAWTAAGGMQALPLLAGTSTAEAYPMGINEAGHITGQATDAAGVMHAVIWTDPGQAPTLVPGLTAPSSASAINDAGQVAGVDAGGAFLWSPGGGVQHLGDLGGGYAVPYALNAHGAVVGYSATADGTHHAFLWTAAEGMQDLGLPPGATHAEARAIDDAGRVVVNTIEEPANSSDIVQRAFLLAGSDWIELGSEALGAPYGAGINQQLQVAGGGFTEGGNRAIRWQVTVGGTADVIEGFFAPVANLPASNTVRAGQGVPLKFSLGRDAGLDILAAGYPASQPIPCAGGAATGSIEDASTAGGSTLTYDVAADQYTYIWKTERGWAGTCRRLTVRLVGGAERAADFHFTR